MFLSFISRTKNVDLIWMCLLQFGQQKNGPEFLKINLSISRYSPMLDRSARLAMESIYDSGFFSAVCSSRSYHQRMLCSHSVDYMVKEQTTHSDWTRTHSTE